jgi:hypothetical protein
MHVSISIRQGKGKADEKSAVLRHKRQALPKGGQTDVASVHTIDLYLAATKLDNPGRE